MFVPFHNQHNASINFKTTFNFEQSFQSVTYHKRTAFEHYQYSNTVPSPVISCPVRTPFSLVSLVVTINSLRNNGIEIGLNTIVILVFLKLLVKLRESQNIADLGELRVTSKKKCNALEWI